MKNQSMIIVVVAVIVAGAAFFGGMKYQQSQAGSSANFANGGGQSPQGGTGGRFGRNGANGLRPVVGQILSMDANSITVKLQDGSSKIVILSDSTRIEKTSPALKTDLTNGATVSAFGTANSDGSITAQNVQLNPEMIRGGRTGGTGGQGMMPQGASGPQQ